MIANLLVLMRDRLIDAFHDTLPNPQIVLKADLATSQKLPWIQLSAGAFELNARSHERAYIETSIAPITVLREFRQAFAIDVISPTSAQAEALVSLAIAILLTNHDALLDRYNTADPKTEYRTAQFTSLHHLSQFRLLEGIPLDSETGVRIMLKFEAIGQLKMTQTSEGQQVIQNIPITVQYPQPDFIH